MNETWEQQTNAQSKSRRTVVLVHGIFDTSRIFAAMAAWLQRCGFHPLAPDLAPNNGTVGLDELAAQLAAFVHQNLSSGEPFDLVGFSMGGLVSRYYVQRLGGIERVGRLITISAPHHGTYSAYALGNPGSRQMRPGSAFLEDLNRDAARLERVRFASIWTPLDLMILPAESSRLGIGEEFKIPVAVHPWMLTSRRSLELVANLLRVQDSRFDPR
jgi:triacylglycerol lipase